MNNIERIFSKLETPEAPASLARAILVRIERRERRVLIAKIIASVCMFGVSLLVIGVGLADFRASIVETGFLQFASLLFSDFSTITSNLPDFALSMIESFPAFSAAAMLAGTGFAVWSLAAIADEVSAVKRHKFLLIS
jgi:uncharacterized membrane protein